ncbi:MAG: RNA methyltransferase [Phycisphaerales bacterium]|nr:RNA methyltransferase [Phycisphaerales bacterium]
MVQADRAYTQVDLTGPTALVIGAEDKGLDETWQQAAKLHGHCVTIPMAASPVDSLNASNAAAILLFEALRQRRMASHP